MTMEKARRGLAGVQSAEMRGDNLAILLASFFEPGIESEEMDESGTWKQGAIDACYGVLDAIHAHYAAALPAIISDAKAEAWEEAAKVLKEAADGHQQLCLNARAAGDKQDAFTHACEAAAVRGTIPLIRALNKEQTS